MKPMQVFNRAWRKHLQRRRFRISTYSTKTAPVQIWRLGGVSSHVAIRNYSRSFICANPVSWAIGAAHSNELSLQITSRNWVCLKGENRIATVGPRSENVNHNVLTRRSFFPKERFPINSSVYNAPCPCQNSITTHQLNLV